MSLHRAGTSPAGSAPLPVGGPAQSLGESVALQAACWEAACANPKSACTNLAAAVTTEVQGPAGTCCMRRHCGQVPDMLLWQPDQQQTFTLL